MEVATLPRPKGFTQRRSPAAWAREHSRAFWIVVGLTALAAVLRFATLGVQSYHHDEIVTASRILRSGFGHAMNAVWFSESTPPIYYAIAWVWTQLVGTGEFGLRTISAVAGVATVPVAYLIGVELRGRRAGLWAAALVAVNPMMLWYSQEARAYALVALFGALSILYWLRAERSGSRRDLIWWGVWSALALGTHYFVAFPIAAEAVMLLRRRGKASQGRSGRAMMSPVSPVTKVAAVSASRWPSVKLPIQSACPIDIWWIASGARASEAAAAIPIPPRLAFPRRRSSISASAAIGKATK